MLLLNTLEKVTTVIVSGPHTLRVHSNTGRLAFKNVRFLIKDNAHFWLDLPMDNIESEDILDGLATFTGVYYQVILTPSHYDVLPIKISWNTVLYWC